MPPAPIPLSAAGYAVLRYLAAFPERMVVWDPAAADGALKETIPNPDHARPRWTEWVSERFARANGTPLERRIGGTPRLTAAIWTPLVRYALVTTQPRRYTTVLPWVDRYTADAVPIAYALPPWLRDPDQVAAEHAARGALPNTEERRALSPHQIEALVMAGKQPRRPRTIPSSVTWPAWTVSERGLAVYVAAHAARHGGPPDPRDLRARTERPATFDEVE